MLTPQENERLTRVGPGTPMGEVFRRYWLPALLSEELPAMETPPVKVRLLGLNLIAFRNFFGKVRVGNYPTWEGGGMVWAYLGPPSDAPPPPDLELVRAPATHRFVTKIFQDCNYLQALEGGLDSAHATIMHNQKIGDRTFLSHYEELIPHLEVEKTDYGYTYSGVRRLGEKQWIRKYHYVMPVTQMRGRISGPGMSDTIPTISGHMWVPADDVTTCVFNWSYSYDPAVPIPEEYRAKFERHVGRGPDDLIPGTYRLRRNLENDFLIDRQKQKVETMTGIDGINTQDVALQEGMGPVVDRTKEHLGTTDRAIIVMRQLLLEATHDVEAGRKPRGWDSATYRDVRALDHIIPGDLTWKDALEVEALAKF
ncbi:MAG TPA: hypothetical protein VN603_04980 [Candidatus Acidoferrales bacterium]|nr:hypothetical protein [Candidatus Acidoferrales bacterium]